MSNDTDTGWAVAGAFLEAFAGQDFVSLAECLDPDVHFRALIPPGLVDVTGVDDTVGRFRHWFGAHPNEARDVPVRVALSNSFAFGGNSSVIVLSRYGGGRL